MVTSRIHDGPLTQPNMPDGSWSGLRCFAYQPRPPAGQPIVYFLYEEDEIVYIGSTDCFEARISVHKNYRRGKRFTSWRAFPYPDRMIAYSAEFAAIAKHRPRLNCIPGGE